MKCERSKCTRTANRQGLCHQHYGRAPLRGYVDSGPTKRRIELLLSRGFGWQRLEAAGVSRTWWTQMGDRVQARVEAKVLSLPVPARVVPGGEVSALGTVRRIQALAALGWPQCQVSVRMGRGPAFVNQLLRREFVRSATAADVDRVYRELHMIPGPSDYARGIARKHKWVPPMAWEDIDDPQEKPNVGSRHRVSAVERIRELREMGITGREHIAARLGVSPDAVERALMPSRNRSAA